MPTEHLFKTPPPSARLWRFMDLGKLIALLETQHLFLAPITSFEDPFEGHPPKLTVLLHRTMPFGLSEQEYERLSLDIDHTLTSFRELRESIAASCWHMNNVESAAMWGLYLRSGEGIALHTSFSRLLASIGEASTAIRAAVVQYVDFDSFHPGNVPMMAWGTFKRSSFAHERELRLLAEIPRGSPGLAVPVELSKLIESIHLAPTTPDWLARSITKLVDRYGLRVPVQRSRLLDPPAYYESDG